MNNEKLRYLVRSAARFFEPVRCPNCGYDRATKTDQKYFFTRLFECDRCHLQFRHPADSKRFNQSFYQSNYAQHDGITTDLPDAMELAALVRTDFRDSHKNVKGIVQLLKALSTDLNTIRLVDYGSSWGYMSYQFKKQGIATQSFEISVPRATYGNKNLGLDIKTSVAELSGGNDVVFSSHVIEHVPSITEMVDESKKLLNENGLFIAESPNGSSTFRKRLPSEFHQGWGLVHPNYLSDRFYQYLFQKNPYLITSTPYDLDMIAAWDGKSQVMHKTEGDQLLVVAKPNRII